MRVVGTKGIMQESSWKWRVRSGQWEVSNKKFNTVERIGQKGSVEQQEVSCKFLQEQKES